MSADEIVFDDVTYREPRRGRRPDLDPAAACIAVGTPGPDDLPIFLDRRPADAIERHALSDTSVELGGILLGRECLDEQTGRPFVWITEALEARHYENTQASFTYTHDSWEEITRERDARFPDLDIVGWYHTHPDFGIFLSGHDLFIHHHFFGQPLQVAYVVDPVRLIRGFFRWHDGQVVPVGGFFLSAPRGERVALARLANDLENLPSAAPQGGLGGLSPRLEAELIAMLQRPHSSVAAPPATAAATSAAVFGLFGLVLGVLLLAAGLWLNGLARTVGEQTEALKELEAAVQARAADAEVARVIAKENALDALLREVRIGTSSESFLALYEQAVRERDQARAEREAIRTDKEALNEMSTRLVAERADLDKRLASAHALINRLQAGAREAENQEQAIREAFNAKLDAQEKLLKETAAGVLARKYTLAWYVAAGALGACVLLGLGLVWALARVEPLPPEPDEAGGPEPPHRIV